ncbi:hypothetical protein ACFU99_06720 [Streptomyces sp. NPDC057654]|uniref:hypothetical protein n=1 Tax=Streptomyces sp. NPDC057654 TaxID=3346196 RepID=UPI0036C58B6F
MIDDAIWQTTKEHFPIGILVRGRVKEIRPFGFFLEITENPEAVAVVDAISYLPNGSPVPPEEWPAPGDSIAAKVVAHAEHNRQIKLRVEPLDASDLRK